MALNLQTKINLTSTDPTLAVTVNGGPLPEDEHLHIKLGADYKKYNEMRRDPRVRSLLNKRRQTILGRRVLVEAGGDRLKDRTGVKQAETILKAISYESLCSKLLNTGQLIGFSVLRLDWKEQGDLVIPVHYFVPQDRFVFTFHDPDRRDIPVADDSKLDPATDIVLVQGYELRLLTRRSPLVGERCPKNRFLTYTFDGDGSPWGLGLGYSIYPWAIIKREAMKAWLLHSDRLGSPPVIGIHPRDVNERNPEVAEVVKLFERFLAGISPNGWAKLPEGWDAKVLDSIGIAGPTVHQELIRMADAQMSIAILGEVQYSDKVTGSYAANVSQVEDRESSLIDSDVNLLDEQLDDQLWKPIAELNYPRGTRPLIRRETIADARLYEQEKQKEEALNSRANRDATLIGQVGLVPTDKYVKETYGEEWSLPKEEPEAEAGPVEPLMSLDDAANVFGEPDGAIDFAAKKGGDGVKKCKKGVSCGNSCIAKNRTCRESLTASQQAKKKRSQANSPGDEPVSVPQSSPSSSPSNKPKQVETKKKTPQDAGPTHPDFQRLYDLAQGTGPDGIVLSDGEVAAAKGLMKDVYTKTKNKKAIEKAAGATSEEADALSHWLGMSFDTMSSRIWNPGSVDDADGSILAATILAAKALHRLPPITKSQAAAAAKKRKLAYNPDEPLNRWMTIDPPDEFLKKYQNAIGQEITEDNFFGTSHLNADRMKDFSANANIEYRIKPKLDGTGQGRYVDQFKDLREGEVLYPPYSRFRVASVKPRDLGLSTEEIEAVDLVANSIAALELSHGLGDAVRAKIYKSRTGKDLPSDQDITAARTRIEQKSGMSFERFYESIGGRSPATQQWVIELEEV